MNLRRSRRQRQPFSGFTKAEVSKMETYLIGSKEQSFDKGFFKKLASSFNRSSNRAGKPVLKWMEIDNWFKENRRTDTTPDTSNANHKLPDASKDRNDDNGSENTKTPEGDMILDTSKLEFEARSSKDGAWYDVHSFLAHRFLHSGEMEVYVRYVGFEAEEDEWINVRNNMRERSIALEHHECEKVKIGDLVVCFQERYDLARYYDAHVIDIKRRLHDIRGCRCLFLIRYDNDNTQELVSLNRLCCRPDFLSQMRNYELSSAPLASRA